MQDLLILLLALKSTGRQAHVLGSTGDALPQAGFAIITSKSACQLAPSGSSLASGGSWQRLRGSSSFLWKITDTNKDVWTVKIEGRNLKTQEEASERS